MNITKVIGLTSLSLLPIIGTAEAKNTGRRGYVLSSRSATASWHDYSNDRTVASRYRHSNITASRRYPCGTILKVFNKANKKWIFVTVRDWGPNPRLNRQLDLNKVAYRKIANPSSGTIRVTYYVVKMGKCNIHRH
jgi:rare lipoprotein A (peptidoglycan hydrolase)